MNVTREFWKVQIIIGLHTKFGKLNQAHPYLLYLFTPANLAQWHAALLPLQPTRTSTRQSSVAPAPQLAPTIVPAPVVQYHYLPPPLARVRAALPPLVPLRGRENNITATSVAPATVPAPVVQYHYLPPSRAQARAALPPLVPLRGRENNTTAAPQSFVCLILLLYLIFIY